MVPRRVPKLAQTHPPGTGVGVSPEAATAPEIAPGTSLGMPWDGLSPAAPRVIPRRVPQVALFWPIWAPFDPLPDPPHGQIAAGDINLTRLSPEMAQFRP